MDEELVNNMGQIKSNATDEECRKLFRKIQIMVYFVIF